MEAHLKPAAHQCLAKAWLRPVSKPALRERTSTWDFAFILERAADSLLARMRLACKLKQAQAQL